MRLKEPLYGLRSAGGHYLLHLGLVIAMIYIEGHDYAQNNGFKSDSVLEPLHSSQNAGSERTEPDEGDAMTEAADAIITNAERYPSVF